MTMDNDRIVSFEAVDNNLTPSTTPSTTLNIDFKRDERKRADAPLSCFYLTIIQAMKVINTVAHCDDELCKFYHNRWMFAFCVLLEITQLVLAPLVLSMGLVRHNQSLLRYRGFIFITWWQMFMSPRRRHAGKSIALDQLAACLLLVWVYAVAHSEWCHWNLFHSFLAAQIATEAWQSRDIDKCP
ncbi:hypothetical protein F4810DRAFT_705600 [Camillea tinctor]|nr:hypothetical protein F4810DRAFT_705600 [Camillea tinctor]